MSISQETVLSDNAFLVSQTDAKGNISFVNDEFCHISEYKIDDLIGKPHNIVRHSDMPKSVFKDFWITIKSGEVWNGYVKNITASGGYYWVFATVYPYLDKNGSQCYLSCRRKPTIQNIRNAENLYKTMN